MSKERHERFALGIKKGKNCQMSKEQRERFALGHKKGKNCQKLSKTYKKQDFFSEKLLFFCNDSFEL